jgi:hypothetical protein
MRTKFWLGNLKGTDHSEDLGVDGKIKSEWILVKECGMMWAGRIWFRISDQWRALLNLRVQKEK